MPKIFTDSLWKVFRHLQYVSIKNQQIQLSGNLNFKRMKKIILINAVTWATLLLGAAGLLNDHPNFIYMFFGIVIAFSILHGLLADFEKRKRKTCTE